MWKNLMYLFMLAVPFAGVSPLQRVANIPVGIVLVAITAIMMGCFLFERGLAGYRRLALETPSVKIVLLFWIMSAAAAAYAAGVGINGIGREHILELGYLVFALLVLVLTANSIESKEDLTNLLRSMVIAGFVASLAAIVLLIGAMVGAEWGRAMPWTVPRLNGTVPEGQVFGNYIISVLPFMFSMLLFRNNLFSQKIWFVFAVFGLSALVMTFALGAWAGFVGGMVPVVLYRLVIRLPDRSGLIRVLGVILAVAVFFAVIDRFIYPNYREGFKSITYKISGVIPDFNKEKVIETNRQLAEANFETDNTDAKYVQSVRSKAERAWFRQAAWNMFLDSPVIGVGAGNFGTLYEKYKPAGAESLPYPAKAHNQFLEVLAETGVIGFSVFCWFLVMLFVTVIKTVVRCGSIESGSIMVGLGSSLAAVVIQGYSYGFVVHIYFWVLAGLILGGSRLVQGNDRLVQGNWPIQCGGR